MRYYLTLGLFLTIFLIAPSIVWAWGYSEGDTINNTINNTTIVNGISDDELAAGLSMAMASGGHELDFSTQDWQGSVTYAVPTDDTDNDAFSFKVGKRWDKFANVLMHVSYTPEPNSSDIDVGDYVVIGGTFRF